MMIVSDSDNRGKEREPSDSREVYFSYQDELSLVRHFARTLDAELAGRTQPRIINVWPLDVCQVGVLRPTTSPERASRDRPHQGSGSDTREEEPLAESAAPSLERKNASDMGLEFLVEDTGEGIEIAVSASFALYTRHFPSYAEQIAALEPGALNASPSSEKLGTESSDARGVTMVDVFQRNEVDVKALTVALSHTDVPLVERHVQEVQREIDKALASAASAPDAYRMLSRALSLPLDRLQDEEQYKAFLASRIADKPVQQERIVAAIEVRAKRVRGALRTSCYLRNLTPSANHAMTDNCRLLADAKLHVSIIRGRLTPIELLAIPKDYQFDRRVWGLGHGTSTAVSDDKTSMWTQGVACYEQPRVTTRVRPSAEFAELAAAPIEVLERIRKSMEEYAGHWRERVLGANTLRLDRDALEQCEKDCKAFEFEIDLFSQGIATLHQDERLLQAFQGMNRVFGRLAHKRLTGWRLFQIVFLVAQLPALAIREGITEGEWPAGTPRSWQDVLDRADVLWFPTGGGKTEAYMGLVSCACLYDRLRGKSFGLTAWLRFPLRMLSVQQLQRAMSVIWETEQERRSLPGDVAAQTDPISLGYFVGKSSTPNWLSARDLADLEDEAAADRIRVITDCPACGKKGAVKIVPDGHSIRAKHVCSACQAELPLYVIDDEIYRFLPSLLIGTVDKIATVSYQASFPLLWGAAQWRCPRHGYGFGTKCPRCWSESSSRAEATTGLVPVEPRDPSPSLQIQDELHLLQEELGTFAGHYETLVRHCQLELGGRSPKVLAATATIEGYERHARHLYGCRSVARFPGRGFDRYNTYYTQTVPAPDSSEPTAARVFVAIRPASMHHVAAAARCAEILLSEITQLYEDPSLVLTLAPTCKDIDAARALLVYYSTVLSYVGSLHNGARTFAQLQRSSASIREGHQRELSVEFHSSRSTVAKLADFIDRTQNPPAWSSDRFLDAVVATDVISHGVDLERINLMVMDSIPEEIGRYIQVSSRGGRTHVGLIIGVLPRFSKRASSIYHRFREFHSNLERMVSPVPVNRFARHAISRTAPGILCGILLGRLNPRVAGDLRNRRDVAEILSQMEEDAVEVASDLLKANPLLSEAAAAYAIGKHIYPESLEESFMHRLVEEVNRFRFMVLGSRERYLRDCLSPRPMTSLRDVEKGVPFAPDPSALETAIWFAQAKGG